MIEHVYIHIPFCSGKCHYCSFVSGKNIEDKDKYLNALLKQILAKILLWILLRHIFILTPIILPHYSKSILEKHIIAI